MIGSVLNAYTALTSPAWLDPPRASFSASTFLWMGCASNCGAGCNGLTKSSVSFICVTFSAIVKTDTSLSS